MFGYHRVIITPRRKGSESMQPLRIAALVKQVPKFEQMQLGPDGRLKRDGLELSLNPYCQRAVSKGVELAQKTGGSCTVISLGPPAAEDVIRWGVAWGADHGILISDPAFAGSDTLATARALAAAVEKAGPFDLILVGKNSVDADTGQVGPELAELLGYPFASAVRTLDLDDEVIRIGCEHDDAWVEAEITLPAILAIDGALTYGAACAVRDSRNATKLFTSSGVSVSAKGGMSLPPPKIRTVS
jgi:electron transfer flavoprotein alpha/beta subunit